MELFVGILLVLVTVAVGTAIGMKANNHVRNFNEDEHEIFVGREGK